MARLRAALGITPRSSSAVLVAVAEPVTAPRLLDRRRIDLVGSDLPAQAYHAAAAGLPLDEASALIDRWASAALAAASGNIQEILAEAAGEYHVVGAGLVAVVRPVPPLTTVLRSHPLLHVAEGQLSREALAEAAARAQLPMHYLAPKGPHDPDHDRRATALRGEVGAPWRKEHRLATVAALTVLST